MSKFHWTLYICMVILIIGAAVYLGITLPTHPNPGTASHSGGGGSSFIVILMMIIVMRNSRNKKG